MSDITQLILSLSAVATAGSMIFMVPELHRVRRLLETGRRDVGDRPLVGSFSGQAGDGPQAGYAIYVYRDGHWQLEADLSAAGCEATAPTIAGSFEGQVVKKDSCVKA